MKRWMIMLLFLVVPAGYAFAGGHGRGGHDGKGERIERMREHRITERRAERREWRQERWERQHRADRRPPGWDHGKKTGWHGGSVPPGQAKKNAHHHGRYTHRGVRPVHTTTPPVRPGLPRGTRHDLEQRRTEHARIQPAAR